MRGKIPYIHIVLFVLTLFSTVIAGALQKGVDIFKEPYRLVEGIPFSLTLMLILLSHELSHYFASKLHRTKATLPYFIPAPSIIGTFGAFIKMKSPIVTRKALIDIGASGPIIGFGVSVVASVVGLMNSEVIVSSGEEYALSLGDSLLFAFLAKVVLGVTPEGYDILLHPIAFAGWIGLFVTSLNLLPIGQLDGGHIAFALFGNVHRFVSMALVIALAVLGFFIWTGWGLWAFLMIILGLRHPPVMYWETPLDPKRKFIGWLALTIFILTFIPAPFTLKT
jgi:membrane-associated protease RseP (regulator of RpoE activity)